MAIQVPRRKQKRTSELHLPRKVKAALADFQRRVLALFPGQIGQLVLYGSYARGEATPDSDVDVMVIVSWDDPQQPGGYYLGRASDPRWQQTVDAAIDAMIAHGPFISALVVSESLFNSNWPIAKAAKQEGVVLWTNQPT
jgi:hypothetical protein